MNFSEYFNALYPYLSDGDKPLDFFEGMIGHFIYEEAQEACLLLNGRNDTKRRYFQKKNSNNIKPEYAQYAYAKHDPRRYQKWLYDRMYRQDTFDRIEKWLSDKDIEFNDVCAACDDLLERIFLDIAHPNASVGSDIYLPTKDIKATTGSSLLSEKDKKILKEFHIDFDSILEKCIAIDHTEVWYIGKIAPKIDSLYNDKWRKRIAEFEDINLQSGILDAIATLREFCRALDPDGEPVPGSSVRRLRLKLRNIYVKTHPDHYVGIFPYDAFIDDWNDGDEY